MLEVNDFNQVRLGLASPQQVRSWSYGEVTKPETINYRTLKPEKDGLFCEKIFGPSKDFECVCGKYKRVRYRGIVCDKCGVEVTRAKVRRERMGHIELASPVSHIWFVKGTPSKLSLLLDITPRNLERVLYFAQHMVLEVDSAARQRYLDQLEDLLDRALEERLTEVQPQVELYETRLENEGLELESKLEEKIATLESERQTSRDLIENDVKESLDLAESNLTKLSPQEISLFDEVIIEEGEKITKTLRNRVRSRGKNRLADFDKETRKLIKIEKEVAKTAVEDARVAIASTLHPLQEKKQEIVNSVKQEFLERRKDLEEIVDPVEEDKILLLTDARSRELQESFPGVFKCGMGAEAVINVLERLNLATLRVKLKNEIQIAAGQRRKKATKRLEVVEDLIESGNRPEWMIFRILPVLPPELRPMVQLDGGRFATSDLNDLYRRVINRSNRLKRLLELGAPEIIVRNEKRMLQEAVDSLIDNGRRGRAVVGSGNHKLKSLSDMLKGKHGRFRQNLLGKRVDYSGRSVIVVGPELKLGQCGLPKRMALELFKPFVMHALVAKGLAHNIKSAKRVVERARPEVWDVLDEVIKDRPVLLNRAPTLHRLGIQAFQPVLIEGSAVQLHPLVCSAFNADFDGDQMAVHVPLSREAVAEAKQIMLSTNNLLSPASGDPTVTPTLDMVLGCYYMTEAEKKDKAEPESNFPAAGIFSSFDEARLASDLGQIRLREVIKVRTNSLVTESISGLPEEMPESESSQIIETTVGRIIFNSVLPDQLPFQNLTMDRPALREIVSLIYREIGNEATAVVVDKIKDLGFHYATFSGITIAIHEIKVPDEKNELVRAAEDVVSEYDSQYQMGLITDDERYQHTVETWSDMTQKIEKVISDSMADYGSINYMASSGTKGNITQIRQMAGLRGLMTDPSGRVIEQPILKSFREGLTVLEYFISTHGARKGLADTALRTADSGYLTRRLIDVAQDVIVTKEDCGTAIGLWIERSDGDTPEEFRDRLLGRFVAQTIVDSETGEIILEERNEIDEQNSERIVAASVDGVSVLSPMCCEAERGICQVCYGRDLARGSLVELNTAVGIIAAQSIGEPGTQLTMRTFHTGGVAGTTDITSGLPRVEELFEARSPRGEAIICEIDGNVEVIEEDGLRLVRVANVETISETYDIPEGSELLVKTGAEILGGDLIAAEEGSADEDAGKLVGSVASRIPGLVKVRRGKKKVDVVHEVREEREYIIPIASRLLIESGQFIEAGTQITEGARNPQTILGIQGRDMVRAYLVDEVQKVYRTQGVKINDKHIEVITRQLLRRVRVDDPGDTSLLPDDLKDRREFDEEVQRVVAEGGVPASAQPVLLGVTKASLNTDSWLAAASFQETTRVLTNASVAGKKDSLVGLKENVIIGKLIPARAEIEVTPRDPYSPDMPESLFLEEEFELENTLAEKSVGTPVFLEDLPDGESLSDSGKVDES